MKFVKVAVCKLLGLYQIDVLLQPFFQPSLEQPKTLES